MTKIIGVAIVGKAGSGKSTVATELAKQGYVRLAFAAKLKELANQTMLRTVDKLKPEDRKFLQDYGTLARCLDDKIWITHLALTYAGWLRRGYKKFVVDDCRFNNEADFLREQDFVIIKLTGRGYDLGNLGKHQSETEMDKIKVDFTVDNSGNIKDTVYEIEHKLKQVIKEKNKNGYSD